MKYLLSLIFICSIGSVFAQQKSSTDTAKSKASSRWSLSVIGGPTNNYFTDEQPLRSSNVGYSGGIRAHYNFPKKWLKGMWSLQAHVSSVGAGGKLLTFRDDTGLGFDPTITFKNTKLSSYIVHNVEFGLTPAYTINIPNNLKLSFYAGPSFSITYNEWEKYEKTGYLLPPTNGAAESAVIGTITNRQFVDYFQPYWFSVFGGMEITYPIVKHHSIGMDFRFSNGTTPIRYGQTYIANNFIFAGDIRSNNARISLSYKYDF